MRLVCTADRPAASATFAREGRPPGREQPHAEDALLDHGGPRQDLHQRGRCIACSRMAWSTVATEQVASAWTSMNSFGRGDRKPYSRSDPGWRHSWMTQLHDDSVCKRSWYEAESERAFASHATTRQAPAAPSCLIRCFRMLEEPAEPS